MSDTWDTSEVLPLDCLCQQTCIFLLLSFVSVCLWGESVGEANQAAAVPRDFSVSHIMRIKLI